MLTYKFNYRAAIKRSMVLALFVASVVRLPAQETVNYDESKVPHFILPGILTTSKGNKITNKSDWEKLRRPEILMLFKDNVYGQLPSAYDSITYTNTRTNKAAMGGKAVLREVLIEIFKDQHAVKINLVLFIPANIERPAGVFLLINNRGKENTDPTRTNKSEFWPAETVIDSGYAIAAFHVGDLAPDDKALYTKGVLQLYPDQLLADNGMRAIGAWAWGASRVMDYFETSSEIDPNKVAIVGHSRGGKASLWAAANDRRFAMCISNCSGNTGAALARRQFGERIKVINTTFPHWFAPNYKKFNDREGELPTDQHMLIGLIAPRPIYATNASKDLWADPKGTFLSLKNAEAVYRLYHVKSDLPTEAPAINQALITSRIAYHNREGKHDLTMYDWMNFIRFANLNFKKKPK